MSAAGDKKPPKVVAQWTSYNNTYRMVIHDGGKVSVEQLSEDLLGTKKWDHVYQTGRSCTFNKIGGEPIIKSLGDALAEGQEVGF